MKERVLITGAGGQLGSELCRLLGRSAIGLSKAQFDIADLAHCTSAFAEHRPSAVVNCAAYTAVDLAEREPQQCERINAAAVANLAALCAKRDIPLVQLSTDYVFGAAAALAPLTESDEPAPLNVYGHTKLAGEIAARMAPRHFVVRSCGLYSAASQDNFVAKILARALAGKPLRIVNDQRCSPTSVSDLAQSIQFLLSAEAYGTYHVVNSGAVTWFEFAQAVVELAEIYAEVEPITTAELALPAVRPAYSALDSTNYHALGGPPIRDWRAALAATLQ